MFCGWEAFAGREVGYICFIWGLGICDLVSCCDVMICREGCEGEFFLFYLVGISFSTALSWWGMSINLEFGNWELGFLNRGLR